MELSKPVHRARLVLTIFFALVALYLFLRFGVLWYLKPESRIPGDFNVYWTAAERIDAAQNIYNPYDTSPFKYSPTFISLFRATFFTLEKKLAAALWMVLSAWTYLGALLLLSRRMVIHADQPERFAAVLVLATLLSWRGFLETLSYGQIDLLLGAAILLILAQAATPEGMVSRRSILTRAFLWMAILIVKPHMLLLLLPACLVFGLRDGIRAGITTGVAYLLPISWLGMAGAVTLFTDWIRCLTIQQDATFMTGNLNQSLASVAARVTGNISAVGMIGAGVILAYLILLGWLALRVRALRTRSDGQLTPESRLALLALSLSGYLLCSPLSWRWCIFLWVPIAAVVLFTQKDHRKLIPWALLALLSQNLIARPLGLLQYDTISFTGVYMLATLSLFAALLHFLVKQTRARPIAL